MKEITLTQGKTAKVDDEDFEYLNQFNWQAIKVQMTWYAKRTIYNNGVWGVILMHRLVAGVVSKSIDVDHKDNDGLNNQKCNLRTCTRQQNCFNRTSQSNSSSKYLGVSRVTTKKAGNIYYYWCAQINKNGKRLLCKRFKTEIEAAKAYDEKASELFGEFANLNFKENFLPAL